MQGVGTVMNGLKLDGRESMSEIHVLYRREYDGSGFAILRAYEDNLDAVSDLALLKKTGATGEICVESMFVEAARWRVRIEARNDANLERVGLRDITRRFMGLPMSDGDVGTPTDIKRSASAGDA